MLHTIPSTCKGCNTQHESLYPIRGGICKDCLVKDFTLEEALKATCSCMHEAIKLLYEQKEATKVKRLKIQVAFVHGREYKGRASQLTVPDCDMSVKDLRGYLLRCFQCEDGTSEDQETMNTLLEKCGINVDSLKNDPIEIRESISGCFMEKDTPNWPVMNRMHVLFLHPTALQ